MKIALNLFECVLLIIRFVIVSLAMTKRFSS